MKFVMFEDRRYDFVRTPYPFFDELSLRPKKIDVVTPKGASQKGLGAVKKEILEDPAKSGASVLNRKFWYRRKKLRRNGFIAAARRRAPPKESGKPIASSV